MNDPTPYFRPKTRGELRDKLIEGVPCEVAEYCYEMTGIVLRGWLKFEAFTIRPSENEGWVVFEPKMLDSPKDLG